MYEYVHILTLNPGPGGEPPAGRGVGDVSPAGPKPLTLNPNPEPQTPNP